MAFMFMRLPFANKNKYNFAYSNFLHAQQIIGMCNCVHAAASAAADLSVSHVPNRLAFRTKPKEH